MKYFSALSLFLCFLAAAPFVYAQQAATPQLQAPAATPPIVNDDGNIKYVYEHPTLEKLSQLYWALSKLDVNKDSDVDNYLMINECDIYRDYAHNEFEWKGIRAAARDFLAKNKNKFSLRFEIMQPLKLGQYDLEKHRFEILDEYQIKGIRRFEALAENYKEDVCGFDPTRSENTIDGYPRALLMELSRPLALTSVDVAPDVAKTYIDDKMRLFKSLRSDQQTERNLFDLRDAYLVMKVKFFSYRQETKMQQGPILAEVLGILEGIDVYADNKKKVLLYSEDYRSRKKIGRAHAKLADELPSGPLLLDGAAPAAPAAPPDTSTEEQ